MISPPSRQRWHAGTPAPFRGLDQPDPSSAGAKGGIAIPCTTAGRHFTAAAEKSKKKARAGATQQSSHAVNTSSCTTKSRCSSTPPPKPYGAHRWEARSRKTRTTLLLAYFGASSMCPGASSDTFYPSNLSPTQERSSHMSSACPCTMPRVPG
jgi:hypothetical protein